VKYEQLESYLPPVEEAGKVNAVVTTTTPRQNVSNQGAWSTTNSNRNNAPNSGIVSFNPQSNRSRGNYNNNYRGRGNNNRGFSHWNQQGSPRQTAPSAQASFNPQTHLNGRGFNNNRGRGNGPPRYQNQRYQQPQAQQQQNVQPIQQQQYYNAGNYNTPQQPQQQMTQPRRCYICHEDHNMRKCHYRFNIPRFQNLYQLEKEGSQGTQEETYPGYPNYLDPNSQQQ
jgi:hypothetical protein